MINLAVIYGGNSLENDISIITFLQTVKHIDKKYKILPIYLLNKMYIVNDYENIDSYINFNDKKAKEVFISNGYLYRKINNHFIKKNCKIDVALLCTHGGNGENGALQGLLEINKIPYTSPNVLMSAIGMNKRVTKSIAKSIGINVLNGVSISNCDEIDLIESHLEFPVITKPMSQGSSIGISISKDINELMENLNVAFKFDTKVLIERALENFREFNIAVYKNSEDIVVSFIDEPVLWKDYLSFDDKYISGENIKHNYPADIPSKIQEYIKKTAKRVYEFLDGKGVVRLDYLLDLDTNKVYLNEINTIPGSLAFYLFKENSITFDKIIDDMINEAMEGFKKATKPTFDTKVLQNYKTTSNVYCKGGSKII